MEIRAGLAVNSLPRIAQPSKSASARRQRQWHPSLLLPIVTLTMVVRFTGQAWSSPRFAGQAIGKCTASSLSWGYPSKASVRPRAVAACFGARSGGGGDKGGSELGQTEDQELRLARELLDRQFLPESERGPHPFEEDPFWAEPEEELDAQGLPSVGTVLVAHPESFFQGGDGFHSLAAKHTLTRYVDSNSNRRELADLPVVLITRRSANGTEGLQLGCWTGKLLGDYGFANFMTRPLYVGGKEQSSLSILHAYPQIPGASSITSDGLAMSDADSYPVASHFVESDMGSPWRFKFFTKRVEWPVNEEHTLRPTSGVWLPMRCSRDLLLREPDSAYEEPLWVQIVQKAGGDAADLGRRLGLILK